MTRFFFFILGLSLTGCHHPTTWSAQTGYPVDCPFVITKYAAMPTGCEHKTRVLYRIQGDEKEKATKEKGNEKEES